jgi:hypothetical protein
VIVSEALIRKPKRGATANLGLVTVGLLAVSIPAWGAYQWWDFRHGLRTDWNISGPPCPTEVHTWPSVPPGHRPKVFDYGGMHIAHGFGGADCSPVPEDYFTSKAYSVCQFTAPVMISVTVGRQTWLFEPGFGRRATVKLRNGRVTCVLAGWFSD